MVSQECRRFSLLKDINFSQTTPYFLYQDKILLELRGLDPFYLYDVLYKRTTEESEMQNKTGSVVVDNSEGEDESRRDEMLQTDEVVQEPQAGMVFSTIDEMLDFYRKYGKQKGFSVKRRSLNKDKDGTVKYVTFTCGRSDKLKSRSNNVLKPRPHMKIGCNARMCGRLFIDGKYIVSHFDDEHNHGLSPSKARFFRCNRQISLHFKRQLEINDIAGIRPNKSHNAQVIGAGGHENLPFLEKDTRNLIAKVRRLRLGDGDANAVQSYFLRMQTQNEGFFSMIDWDEHGRLKNVFWADPRSRAACREFGDVITFDTTYLTNKYDMPFAPFIGVNHHGQSILLGCGLISSEDTETFTWLFQTWLACMYGSAPIGIITDQDRAMKNAIEIVFPTSRHRLCLWHIMKKFPEKLGAYNEYDSISLHLVAAVYDS
ncbi:protein FAR1-RELATED SEQUENCE 5-like [Tripterygium wilfordii]|uniref:protein FAR1-RELATED SEQUENCE 5-like n=1 Tax=Tripterygium wilfordii TaxID=458696 RepID=UPI0018F832D0|nr:protein FAR1-RELATED SEQUENCE 5-like [Tripterygium wilfordii]